MTVLAAVTLSAVLSQDPPPPSQGPEFGGSSPIALVVTLVLLVALVFLIKSMNKHLRKLPKSFDTEPDQRPASGGDGAASAHTSTGDPGSDKPA